MSGDMNTRVPKVAVRLIIGTVGVIAIWLAVPRSGPRDTPFIREYNRIHQICGKLASYAEDHKAFPDGDTTGRSIDGLLAAEIITADDAAYIRDHHIQFHGFDPSRIGGDIPVLEALFPDKSPRRRIVGYSDGSTLSYSLDSKQ